MTCWLLSMEGIRESLPQAHDEISENYANLDITY